MQSHRLLVECRHSGWAATFGVVLLVQRYQFTIGKAWSGEKNQNRPWECVSLIKYQCSRATGWPAGRSGWQRFFPSQAAASKKALPELLVTPDMSLQPVRCWLSICSRGHCSYWWPAALWLQPCHLPGSRAPEPVFSGLLLLQHFCVHVYRLHCLPSR